MQLSLPWILSRKRLITAVIADGVLFGYLYYALYECRFDVWPTVSPRLALLLAIWSLASYVFGRYVSGDRRGSVCETWSFAGKQLIGTGAVLLLTLGIILLYIWLFNQNPVQSSFRSFLIPFLGSLAVLSPVVQITIFRLRCRDLIAQSGPMLALSWDFNSSKNVEMVSCSSSYRTLVWKI